MKVLCVCDGRNGHSLVMAKVLVSKAKEYHLDVSVQYATTTSLLRGFPFVHQSFYKAGIAQEVSVDRVFFPARPDLHAYDLVVCADAAVAETLASDTYGKTRLVNAGIPTPQLSLNEWEVYDKIFSIIIEAVEDVCHRLKEEL